MSTTLESRDITGVAILSRILELADEPVTPAAARHFLSLRFPKADERRMNQLGAKARKGKLTAQEHLAAEQYNLVSHLLALLQAKAHSALCNEGRAS